MRREKGKREEEKTKDGFLKQKQDMKNFEGKEPAVTKLF